MKENDDLLKHFLARSFFKAWDQDKNKPVDEKYGNFNKLELQISPVCDLSCKYCYYSKFSQKGETGERGLYPLDIAKRKTILHNLDMLLAWLSKNNYYPELNLFSGEIFSTTLGFEVLERCIKFLIDNKATNKSIIIPTNMSFIMDDDKTKEVERLISEARNSCNKIALSASIDGKYSDSNRPFKQKGIDRDYDKIFSFCSKHHFSFHPMVYYDEIETWIDNFLWFQDMFVKHNIPWNHIYMLEVRNDGWTVESVKHFYNLVKFVIKYVRSKFRNNTEFIKNLLEHNLINITSSTLSSCGRGIGCSIQSSVQVRLGDLVVHPCHRLSYEHFATWKFLHDDKEITDISSINH
jgi:sulfatase maturation enzyme AslB (radical SAM superfamily)